MEIWEAFIAWIVENKELNLSENELKCIPGDSSRTKFAQESKLLQKSVRACLAVDRRTDLGRNFL